MLLRDVSVTVPVANRESPARITTSGALNRELRSAATTPSTAIYTANCVRKLARSVPFNSDENSNKSQVLSFSAPTLPSASRLRPSVSLSHGKAIRVGQRINRLSIKIFQHGGTMVFLNLVRSTATYERCSYSTCGKHVLSTTHSCMHLIILNNSHRSCLFSLLHFRSTFGVSGHVFLHADVVLRPQ